MDKIKVVIVDGPNVLRWTATSGYFDDDKGYRGKNSSLGETPQLKAVIDEICRVFKIPNPSYDSSNSNSSNYNNSISNLNCPQLRVCVYKPSLDRLLKSQPDIAEVKSQLDSTNSSGKNDDSRIKQIKQHAKSMVNNFEKEKKRLAQMRQLWQTWLDRDWIISVPSGCNVDDFVFNLIEKSILDSQTGASYDLGSLSQSSNNLGPYSPSDSDTPGTNTGAATGSGSRGWLGRVIRWPQAKTGTSGSHPEIQCAVISNDQYRDYFSMIQCRGLKLAIEQTMIKFSIMSSLDPSNPDALTAILNVTERTQTKNISDSQNISNSKNGMMMNGNTMNLNSKSNNNSNNALSKSNLSHQSQRGKGGHSHLGPYGSSSSNGNFNFFKKNKGNSNNNHSGPNSTKLNTNPKLTNTSLGLTLGIPHWASKGSGKLSNKGQVPRRSVSQRRGSQSRDIRNKARSVSVGHGGCNTKRRKVSENNNNNKSTKKLNEHRIKDSIKDSIKFKLNLDSEESGKGGNTPPEEGEVLSGFGSPSPVPGSQGPNTLSTIGTTNLSSNTTTTQPISSTVDSDNNVNIQQQAIQEGQDKVTVPGENQDQSEEESESSLGEGNEDSIYSDDGDEIELVKLRETHDLNITSNTISQESKLNNNLIVSEKNSYLLCYL